MNVSIFISLPNGAGWSFKDLRVVNVFFFGW